MEKNGGVQKKHIQIQSTVRDTCIEVKTVQESLWKFWKQQTQILFLLLLLLLHQSYQWLKIALVLILILTLQHSPQPLIKIVLLTIILHKTLLMLLLIFNTLSSTTITLHLQGLVSHFKTSTLVLPCFLTVLVLPLTITTTLIAGLYKHLISSLWQKHFSYM